MRLARVKSEEEEESKLHIVSEEEEDDDDDEKSSSEDDSDSEEEGVENETGNGTDTANTSITRPDEDTAPAPEPATEKETAATNADSLDPKYMFGPHDTIPKNVQCALDEWHKKHPKKVPPCSYRSRPPKQAWKVFDRNGNEVPFSMFMIKSPIMYKITFIHNEDGSGKLVASRQFSPIQIYLVGWHGLAGYEEEACAVRLFGKSTEEIIFRPCCFDKGRGPMPERAAINGTCTDQAKTRSYRRGGRRSERKSGTSNGITCTTQRGSFESETSENSSSDESSQSEREEISERPTKRSRNSNSDSGLPPSSAVPAPPVSTKSSNTSEVAFKLISGLSDATRCFPITECKSSRDLFAKARKFFRLLDGDLEVKVLSCRIPSKHERRYLFEGGQGEFNLLVHDVRNLQGVSAKTLIIEVKCMG